MTYRSRGKWGQQLAKKSFSLSCKELNSAKNHRGGKRAFSYFSFQMRALSWPTPWLQPGETLSKGPSPAVPELLTHRSGDNKCVLLQAAKFVMAVQQKMNFTDMFRFKSIISLFSFCLSPHLYLLLLFSFSVFIWIDSILCSILSSFLAYCYKFLFAYLS